MNKWAKWVGRIILGILLLLILLVLIIHTAPVKNFIRGKLESYLSNKTHSEVHIAAINYRLPKWAELDGVFLRDKAGDTLLYGGKARVDINMLKLFKGQYEISSIELGNIVLNISRKPNDSAYNFQYLLDAFASKSAQPQPVKKSPVSLSLDEIAVTGSTIRWKDQYGGIMMDTKIGSFHVTMDSLDLDAQKFAVKKAVIDNMRFDMQVLKTVNQKNTANANNATAESILPTLRVNSLAIKKSHFSFKGEVAGINTINDIGDLDLRGLSTTTPQKILLDKLQLDHSSLSLDRSIGQTAAKTKMVDTTPGNISVTVKEVRLFNDNIAYNDLSGKKKTSGFDPAHINIRSLRAGITGIGYDDKTIQAKVDSISMVEQSGFILDSMRGNIIIQDTIILTKNIFIKTPSSRIAGNATIYPLSLDEKYHGNQQNIISFHNNIISRKDIAVLVPAIMEKYNKQLQGVSFIYITADINGNAKTALIKTISVHADKNDISLVAGGTVYNAMSKNALQYDLNIARITATKSFIDPFVNTKGKQTVNLPPVLNIAGKLKGDLHQLTSDLVFTSAYGTAGFKGQLRNFTTPDKLGYNMRLVAKELETGKWINRDSTMGKLTGNILLKGSGIDYKTANIESVLDISSFRLEKHAYTGINFNIDGSSGSYNIKGGIKDSLLRMNMNVKALLNQQYPTAKGKINVANADLYKLGFYKDPFSFRTDILIDAKDLSPQALNALVRLDSTVIHTNHTNFRTDSLVAKGKIDSGQTILTLNSPFADAILRGEYKYNELPAVFETYLARFSKKEKPAAQANPVMLSLDANVKPDAIYALLLPGLFFDKNIHANGKIDTKQKDSTLNFYLTGHLVAYKTNRLSNFRASMNGIGDSIKYRILLDTVKASSLQLYATSITGGFSEGHASARFVTNDSRKKEKYALGIFAAIENDTYKIHLGDTLKLNYANWSVDKQNMIVYSPQGLNIHQFNITKGLESIGLNSSSAANNAPVDIKIDKFALSNITGLFDRDSLEIGGRLNAQVKIDGLGKTVPLFNGTVKIDSLTYQQGSVGDIVLDAHNESNESVTFSGKLTGNGNNVTLKGNYNQDKIDAQVNLDPILFKSVEPFSQKNLVRSSGKLSGNINITGNTTSPEWNGTIRFDSAFTQLAQYGTVLNMSGQQISLKYPVITLNQFTIKDSLNHSLVINGTVQEENGAFNTNLTVKTKNFTALDNTSITNNEIYGKALVDVDVTISGPAATPEITGDVGLKKNSQVTFVRQDHVASAKDREGVIEFIDMDTVKNFVFRPADTALAHKQVTVSMLNYNLNIDIDKEAKFSVIIDPITRDELQVQGSGQLNASVNPNGDVMLTGAYNLSKGSYQLNNKFIKRKFDLQEGSTITLSGDPQNAEADITAVYSIEASPYDLLGNEISESTNVDLYKQKLPFEVILKIKGRAIAPDLSFDIQLKKDVSGVNYDMATTIDNKFQQMRTDASTMNKQVFALLVMGRFIGEQSQDFFAGSNGDGLKADEVVKESVSRFLSDAVSQVAADLIKGVDVDVNLKTVDNYTDATQRTDLNLALSKRFLNDRLNITVGKSFTVDGEDPLAKGQDNSNVSFLPDITTTYKLSKDGRYMLKAYQKSEYEAILDGYFIETGVAFTLSMDYDKFKQLFRKSKKDKKAKQEKIDSKKRQEIQDQKDKAVNTDNTGKNGQ